MTNNSLKNLEQRKKDLLAEIGDFEDILTHVRAKIEMGELFEQRLNKLETEISNIEAKLDAHKGSVANLKEPINHLQTQVEQVASAKTAADAHLEDIQSFHQRLFGNEHNASAPQEIASTKDGEDNSNAPIMQQIWNSIEEIEKFKQEQPAQFADLKNMLEADIRSLLPGAGAAGLASAYAQAKARYGALPYEEKVTLWNAIFAFFNLLKGHSSNTLHYVLFIAPLIFVTWHFSDLAQIVNDPNGGGATWELILMKLAISMPAIPVSLFGWSSLKTQRRLFEEYNHKQRVMQLYHSFKKEIDEFGNDAQMKELLAIMLKTVADKPALVMNEHDTQIDFTSSLKGIAKNVMPNDA